MKSNKHKKTTTEQKVSKGFSNVSLIGYTYLIEGYKNCMTPFYNLMSTIEMILRL